MVFPVSDRRKKAAPGQAGLKRLRRCTALIGATLLYCLSGSGAFAQSYYYNYDGPTDAPDPQNGAGGVWTTANSVRNWLYSPSPDTYDSGNVAFDNGDDVAFLTAGSVPISIELEGALSPDDILIRSGAFVFADIDGNADLSGESLQVAEGASLVLNDDLSIAQGLFGSGTGAVVTLGTLQVGDGYTLSAENGVSVGLDADDSASLIVNGVIDASVTFNGTGAIEFGADGRIDRTLIVSGPALTVDGRVSGLRVEDTAEVSFGGSQAQVDRLVTNGGTLNLGAGRYLGVLNNLGTLNLTADVNFGTTDNIRSGDNRATGVISTRGGSRTLTFTDTFNNEGTLQSGTPSETLTVSASTINLAASSTFANNVVLSGAINNSDADFDLRYAPRLDGTFTNNAGAVATVTTAVDGNGQAFDNAGTLTMTVGTMRGLASFENDGGSVRVSAGSILEASDITHVAGSFFSAGTLIGSVRASADASIRGVIQGSYTVAGGTTTVTGDLDFSSSTAGGRLDVTSGSLRIGDGSTVTVEAVVNRGAIDLGTSDETEIVGSVLSFGSLTGRGGITGNLRFDGIGSGYSGAGLTVGGFLVNGRSDVAQLSQFGNISYGALINAGQLVIDQQATAGIINQSAASLFVRSGVSGTVRTEGIAELANDIDGQLIVTGGRTSVLASTTGMPVSVGGAAGADLQLSAGILDVTGGDLRSTGVVDAAGQLIVASGRTLTAPSVVVSGNSGSQLLGTVDADLTINATGQVALDGAVVTGTVDNSGSITGASTTGRGISLRDGLTNRNSAVFGSTGAEAQITGTLTNTATGVATIVGDVTGPGGNVVNGGILTLRGDVAGQVSNTNRLSLIGDMGGLTNSTGLATIIGNIGTAGTLTDYDVTNSGRLNLTGNVANSLFNTSVANVSGAIGGNAVNEGTMNLIADVGRQIRNSNADSVVNIVGDSSAATIAGVGTTNIEAGNSLDLSNPALVNASGARLNIQGTLESAASATGIDVSNRSGGIVVVGTSGTLDGSMTNSGTATINGVITRDITNASGGTVNLQGSATIRGALDNANVVNVSGADVEVAGGVSNGADAVLAVTGGLTADVTNAATGSVNLAGGTITGTLTNEQGGRVAGRDGTIVGDVSNAGTFTLDLLTTVDGDFVNEPSGVLTQSVGGSRLVVTDTFVNYGVANTGGLGPLRISAATINNQGILEDGVETDGDIRNGNIITYNQNAALNGNLRNDENGIIQVLATVRGDGSNQILNDGRFELIDGDGARTGELLNIDRIENRDLFTIGNGTRVQTNSFVNSAGTLTNNGLLVGAVENSEGANLVSTGTIRGSLVNAGSATLSGRLVGSLTTTNTATDLALVAGDLSVTGPIENRGSLRVVDGANLQSGGLITNRSGGVLFAIGTIEGDVENQGRLHLADGMQGNLGNAGTLTSNGVVTGNVVNSGTATMSGRVSGALSNDGGAFQIASGESLVVGGELLNANNGELRIDGIATVRDTLVNSDGATVRMAAGSTLNGDMRNEASAFLAGTIDGALLNRDDAEVSGLITGDLVNEGADLTVGDDLLVRGRITNRMQTVSNGPVGSGGPLAAPGAPTSLTVEAGTTLTAQDDVTNGEQARLIVDGTLVGDVTNDGIFDLNNRLDGSLLNRGSARLAGSITGDVVYSEGSAIDLTGALEVGGVFDASDDFTIAADDTLVARSYLNRASRELTVEGTLDSLVENRGVLRGGSGGVIGSLQNAGTFYAASGFRIAGSLQNTGTVDMSANGSANDVLSVNGSLSGNGAYVLDLDVNDGDGVSDRVVVRGGAVTGSISLTFARDDAGILGGDRSRNILVFDVDPGQSNDFTYTASNLPPASERTIYNVVRDAASGDLYVRDTINPALGALSGNVALTQSLIGSVVNRPSSPFVPGLAGGAGDKPCGVGAWARAIAGHAKADGQTSSGDFTVASSIEASYRGLQFGGDLACFDNSVKGWNLALGVIGGVNDGTTTQPVYVTDPSDPSRLSNVMGSINRGDFRQLYGGVYATASRDRWFVDLQLRRERTSFTVDNDPVSEGSQGLQLNDAEFDSRATTVSGAVSYAYELPKEGWLFVPTAGFAFSNLSVDPIYFEDDAELRIEDSKNRVGFIGGTVSKTFLRPERNSLINAFGTATVYRDFASDTRSVFIQRDDEDGSITREDGLSSSNLGTYGELSFGLNYARVLQPGGDRAPRQFNASIRIDGRTGDVLDSYGVTAQVRLQF